MSFTRFSRATIRYFALVLMLIACTSQARVKDDVIQLENGDRVTGEIKVLDNGILHYATDSMGTLKVEWNEVTRVDSSYFYRIRTAGGERYFGAIDEEADKGRLRIIHAEGEEEFPIDRIVGIVPVESTFTERLDTVLTLGFSDFKSSDSRTTNAEIVTTYADELSSNALAARMVISENDDETNQSHAVRLSRQRMRDNPTDFTYISGLWEGNDELALDYRVSLAAGLGRYFIDTNQSKLGIILGVQGLTEESTDGDNTESLEGLGIVNYNLWDFESTDLEVTTSWRFYPGITENGRFRSDADVTLKWEIVEDLDLSVSAFGNYDNQTSGDGDDYDYGITTGIAWEF